MPAQTETSATILVVDDEAPVRDILARCLRGAGYRVLQAADADSAWTRLEADDVHLVTADIRMPGRSGIDLLRQVKREQPDTAVVMLTAAGETRLAVAALTDGAAAYLIKPVERDELLFHVRRGLERRQLILENRRYTQGLELQVQQQTLAIRRAHEETIHRLMAASMYRDEETGAHVRRTGLYCEVFAEALGWPAAKTDHIRLAAPMHDVGKIGIPDAILRKPGQLTTAERRIMELHSEIGARMLAGSDSPMLKMAEEIARCHHERWDGTGYPSRLSGLAIPETARMLALVDVYDALTHDRVYRAALSEAQAVEIISAGRGTHFDPYLTPVFLSLLPEMRRIACNNPDEPDEDRISWPGPVVDLPIAEQGFAPLVG